MRHSQNCSRHRTRRGTCVVLVLLAAATCAGCETGSTPNPTSPTPPIAPSLPSLQPDSVTFVGGSGFLIWAGGRKVLVDAVFPGFAGGYRQPAAVRDALVAGRAPFDAIDVVLATHSHLDHFGAQLVSQCLQNNPNAAFAGPADAAAPLGGLGGRVTAVTIPAGERMALSLNGVRVEAMLLSHGIPQNPADGVDNIAYLITLGGWKFFHTGDVDPNTHGTAYLRALGIPAERIDVGLIAHFLLGEPAPNPFVTQGVQPRVIIPFHFEYSTVAVNWPQIQANHPNVVPLRTEMDSWTIR